MAFSEPEATRCTENTQTRAAFVSVPKTPAQLEAEPSGSEDKEEFVPISTAFP